MRWFRFYDDDLNNPKLLRLSDRMHRVWIGLLCVASKNDGKLPSMEDCALMLRLQPERMAEALVSLVGAGLLERGEDETFRPHDWNARQYKSDVSTERVKRYRKRFGDVSETPQNREEQNRAERETLLIEVKDEQALAAWDAYGRATKGKPYPRNKHGTWHHPSEWPPVRALAGRCG
jgi:hypothetical protein